jgi:transketolase
MNFPIDLGAYEPLTLDLAAESLSPDAETRLARNIQLARDAIVFFTALAHARGYGGHTGGAYDITPEVLLAEAFMRGEANIVPCHYDEAGHRVAIQYLLSVLRGHLAAESLLHYREANHQLPGHPERGFTPGVAFSSGRLGHLWPYVNGVAAREEGKRVVLFGSDGAQQEGNDAEAARFAVARGLEVKLIIDDNDVTIAGHPSQYLKGFDVAKTLLGHGLRVETVDAENLRALHAAMRRLLTNKGPAALISKRRMAPGIPGIEGSIKGHDAIPVAAAVDYLRARGHAAAVRCLEDVRPASKPPTLRGSSSSRAPVRTVFGEALSAVLKGLEPKERVRTLVIDSDLGGSCGLGVVAKDCPEVFIAGGIMERGNYAAAAGFGSEPGYQGVFGTFSAFLEMVVSEISMARLNECNVLAHFSHAGVADILDNTCHFGINNFFADNGLGPDDLTRLYFPADQHQMRAVVQRIFHDPGLRFVFSPRSALPDILDAAGEPIYGAGYRFEPGVDSVVLDGSAGWVVSYGDVLHLALDAVLELRASGLDVGLLNKVTLNRVDEASLARVGQSGFVLVAESQNVSTGLGARFGTWLLERGLRPRYARLGTHERGQGGGVEQIAQQGLDPASIARALSRLAG